MKNIFFPTTIIDGFFEDPDSVRNFGLTQSYTDGEFYPGSRSKPISEINPLLFRTTTSKFIDLFFPNQQVHYNVLMTYQLVNSDYGAGWVHRDMPPTATGIIFLNKDKLCGTSIFQKKNILDDNLLIENYTEIKHKSIREKKDDQETRKIFNSCYEEVISVKGLYNRALFFDSNLYHAAHNFFGETSEESRLTIVLFFDEILCSMFPIQRMHKNAISIV